MLRLSYNRWITFFNEALTPFMQVNFYKFQKVRNFYS
jgi:hypothetical protein